MHTSLQRLNQSVIVREDSLAPPTDASMTVCLYELSVVKQCVISITCKGDIFVFSNHVPFAQLINFLSGSFFRFIGESHSLHNFFVAQNLDTIFFVFKKFYKIIFINESCHTEYYAQIMLASTHGRSLSVQIAHIYATSRTWL